MKIADEPGDAIHESHEQVLAQSATDRDDPAHRPLGMGEIAPEISGGIGAGLFRDQVAAIGGDARQFGRVSPATVQDDELVEHVAPAGIDDFDLQPGGLGRTEQLLAHRAAGPEIEELVDDIRLLIEERTRLRSRKEGVENRAGQESVFVPETEDFKVDQRDLVPDKLFGELDSPNINWKRSPGCSSSKRRLDSALSLPVKGMASGSNSGSDLGAEDGRWLSCAEVDLELEFIAQRGNQGLWRTRKAYTTKTAR